MKVDIDNSSVNNIHKQVKEISLRIKQSRKQALLSLEKLASLSGVSRATISKIERGESLPSTTVLAKLSKALGLSMTELVAQQPEDDIVVLKADQQLLVLDPKSNYMRRCLSPILPGRGIDWSISELQPKSKTPIFHPHRQGTEEYMFILNGSLQITIGNRTFEMHEGDSIFYKAATSHAFENLTDQVVRYMIIIDSTKWR